MLTASLGSVTDTLNYNWDCAYANEFPVAVEGLDVDKLRTTAQEAIGLMRGTTVLEGFLGFEPMLFKSKVKARGEIEALR
jgi:hypothetical protein